MKQSTIEITYISGKETKQDILPINFGMINTYIEGLKRYFPKIHIREGETQTYISFLEVEGTDIIDLTIKK